MRTSTQTVPEATIHVARHPRDLEGLVPDPGLGAFFGYAVRAPERTLDGIRRALLHGGRAVLARRGPVGVGYLTLSRPDADQPWGRAPGLPVREITVEVARGWRRRGLARRLFGTLLALPAAEEAILAASAAGCRRPRWTGFERPCFRRAPREGGDEPMKRMVARDIMTTPVITVRPDTPFRELVDLMMRHRVSGLPVVDEGGRLVGVVTEADLIHKEET